MSHFKYFYLRKQNSTYGEFMKTIPEKYHHGLCEKMPQLEAKTIQEYYGQTVTLLKPPNHGSTKYGVKVGQY